MNASEVLFCGTGSSAYYRMFLPASVLGADYLLRDSTKKVLAQQYGDGHEYHTVVYQQPIQEWHHGELDRLSRENKKIVVDIDDDLLHLAKKGDHPNRAGFTKRVIAEHKRMMQYADVVTVSTGRLADLYESIVPSHVPIHIVDNGLDLARYTPHRLPVDKKGDRIIVCWMGGMGHLNALRVWLPEIRAAVNSLEAHFLHVGDTAAIPLVRSAGFDSFQTVPWCSFEDYPKYVAQAHVLVGPTLNSNFYRAKSRLRLYEAAAMGVYPILGRVPYDKETSYFPDPYNLLIVEHDALQNSIRAAVDSWLAPLLLGENERTVAERNSIEAIGYQWARILNVAYTAPTHHDRDYYSEYLDAEKRALPARIAQGAES